MPWYDSLNIGLLVLIWIIILLKYKFFFFSKKVLVCIFSNLYDYGIYKYPYFFERRK